MHYQLKHFFINLLFIEMEFDHKLINYSFFQYYNLKTKSAMWQTYNVVSIIIINYINI